MDLIEPSDRQENPSASPHDLATVTPIKGTDSLQVVDSTTESAALTRAARFWQYAMLLFICSATLLYGLGNSRLWDRDEPRNSRCTVEMLNAGDWIVPVFNEELRTHKPILLYWMQMASYQLAGQNAFGARLPSAVLAFLTIWSVALFVRRFSADNWAFWAAVSLATSLMFVVAGRAATPDALLVSFSCFGILATVCSFLSKTKSRWIFTVVAAMSFGLAILAKGPVGIVLPIFVLAVWYLAEQIVQRCSNTQTSGVLGRQINRSRTLFERKMWKDIVTDSRWYTIVGVAVLIALPWYVAVGFKTNGAWLSGFFLEHNLGRAMGSMEGHDGGVWYYPLATLLGVFPWSLILIPVIVWSFRNFWRDDSRGSITRLGAIWWLSYVFAFSCASTKLPSYITPSYPGLCLLIGGALHDLSIGKLQIANWLAKTAAYVCGLAGVGTVFTFVVVAFQVGTVEILLLTLTGIAFVFPAAAFYFLHESKSKKSDTAVDGDVPTAPSDSTFANPSLVQAAFIFVRAFSRTVAAKMPSPAHAMLVPAVAICSLVMGFGGPIIDSNRISLNLLSQVQNSSTEENVSWSALGTIEPSWVFYLENPIEEISLDERRTAIQTAVDRCELEHSFVIVNEPYVEEFEKELERRELSQITPITQFSRFMSSEKIVVFGTTSSEELHESIRTAHQDASQLQR